MESIDDDENTITLVRELLRKSISRVQDSIDFIREFSLNSILAIHGGGIIALLSYIAATKASGFRYILAL